MLFKFSNQIQHLKYQAAYTLLEMTVVVLILGITAAVVIPDFSSTNPAKLNLAVSEVMQAIRMARSESIRTGEMHGLTISQDTQSIEVKKYDLTTDPVSTDFILRHPIEKQFFDFNMEAESLTAGVKISNTQDAFLFSDGERRKSVLFDPQGGPVWFFGATDSIFRLTDSSIELSYAGMTRIIKVAPLTGRVSEQ